MKNRSRKVAFHTLGCKLNFAETSTIARQLKSEGYEKVSFDDIADVYVINTCSVTENADKECRQIIRRALHRSPDAFIAVTGCYAQLRPEEITSIEGVDVVLGAEEKFNISKYLQQEKKEKAEIHSCEVNELSTFNSSYSHGDRTRAFLKVQDGCDYTCTYCTIPMARGKSRSAFIAEVVAQANTLAEKGIKEIVLTGVNTGDFGNKNWQLAKDNWRKANPQQQETFLDLIQELENIHADVRFRISSIEPNLLTDEIIYFVAQSEKFVPHFHIPLQSGSDKILGLMRRRYRKELYVSRIEKIKSLMSHACIGCDVIVGFPGETQDDFLETYQFINSLDISYLHVFTYSERPDTDAILLDGIVPVQERRKRNRMLRILSEKKLNRFSKENEGRTVSVLWEAENDNGVMNGYSENYLRVKVPYDLSLVNTITPLNLKLSPHC
ncbi:MAG TPA: tRNA (N(6)-L-threonylcarbamoyladenosine(37)-C(2))-methylthiotransferase MtaB [Bacteroidia bacterium]|nr:tRNA (N(6)-L-threonylcarbamoyladenosine(37)-C(2))-methylthiotransferase MtaB [Bacteroidia bacterium]